MRGEQDKKRMQNSTLTKEPTELNEPTLDILEEGILHKIMLLFHLPTRLPGLLVVVLAIILAALTGALWWLVTGDQPMAQRRGMHIVREQLAIALPFAADAGP